MKKLIVNTICFCLSVSFLLAQDFNHYKPLSATGKIPAEFITPSSKKYSSELKALDLDKNKKAANAQKEYVLESNFAIDDILQSGKVLFNDPITEYLNKVAQEVCAPDPELKKKVRVYAIRSAGVNAFATNRGTVFVTVGLLAQLETESQLAFIIAHELVHVREGHSMDMFLKSKGIETDKKSVEKSLKNLSIDEELFNSNQYSKELETEADVEGVKLLAKTRYSTEGIDRVFDVLKYAYLPFDEIPFEKSFLEGPGFELPKTYYLGSVKAISGEDESEDDTESSHPNIAKRRAAVEDLMKNTNNTDKLKYIISKEEFDKMRDIARFEIPSYHLHNDNVYGTIYSAFLLSRKYPESEYLKKMVAQALYIHAKYKKYEYTYAYDYKEVEGESQRVHFLLDTLPAKEAVVLAMYHLYNFNKLYPKDKDVKFMINDLFIEFADIFDDLKIFKNEKPVEVAVEQQPATVEEEVKPEDQTEKSKYDRIKAQKAESGAVVGDQDYWVYAFIGNLNDTTLVNGFKRGKTASEKRQKLDDYYETDKGRQELRKRQKSRIKGKTRLGIDNIVVVNPKFIGYDARPKHLGFKHIESEESQAFLGKAYEDMGKQLKMKVRVLDVCELKENNAEEFNDITALNEWFSEQGDHDGLGLTPGFNQAMINEIAKKYKTKYFLWTGVIDVKKAYEYVGLRIFIAIVYPIFMPSAIAYFAKPNNDMLFLAVLYDVETGKNQVIKMDVFKSKKATKSTIESHVYDALRQIKAKPKKK